MNRQRILACIDRHLHLSGAKVENARSLGELVAEVAEEIRGPRANPHTVDEGSQGTVIPVEKVAAFVDGRLSESECDQVSEAALHDNSVLAELIAAVRTRDMTPDSAPPLSDELAARLMAMHAGRTGARATVDAGADAEHSSAAGEPGVPASNGQTTTLPKLIQPAHRERRVHSQRVILNRRLALAAGIAVAASLVLLAGYGLFRSDGSSQVTEVFDGQPESSETGRIEVMTGDDPKSNGTNAGGTTLLADRTVDSVPEEAANRNSPRDADVDLANVPPREPESPTIATPDSRSVAGDGQRVEPTDDGSSSIPRLDSMPPDLPSANRPSSGPVLKWKEITGLLVRRELRSTGPAMSTGGRDVARPGGWHGVSTDQPDPTPDGPVALRTLPHSRAEAEWEGGGRVVLAGDSLLQLSRSSGRVDAELDLQHGSVALLDVPGGTTVNLIHGNQLIARLKWSEHAAAVLERGASGFQVHIHRGTIGINDQSYQDQAVSVTSDRPIEKLNRPKRLPTWVDRPTDAVQLPRHILAQFAETDNVGLAISREMTALVSRPRLDADDQRTLTTLASWQAAMAGNQLFRMLNSRYPAVRLAALQHLFQLPASDPRFSPTWRNLDRLAASKQRVAHVRRWCEMARRGIRPNASQVDQMIAGLSSQDVAGRAMADFVLRQFYGGGPPFDPTWTGTTQQRAINVWRQRVGRPATRTALPNAAAN